ncbi:MAG TPA: GNAT family N-acetyltransferase [Pirellulales bacterium]
MNFFWSSLVGCVPADLEGSIAPMPIESFTGDRKLLSPLFALGDDSPKEIASYISRGEILVARDGDPITGHLQILETDSAGVFELKSMAVNEAHQGRGIGRSLVEAAVVRCRVRGGHRLIVSTATADIANLRFYQRLGFRMYRIVRDAFSPLRGYKEAMLIDGIPLRDKVFLERDLSPRQQAT